MRAAQRGHIETVKVLFSVGKADIEAKDNDGRTPLILAACYGDRDMIKMLLGIGKANIEVADCHRFTPLTSAVWRGDRDTAEVLFDVGKATVHAIDADDDILPLMLAKNYGHEDIVKLLLCTLIRSSVTSLESIVHFLGFGADSPESAIVTASCSNKEADIILLLQLSVDPILAIREWRFRYSTTAKREMPLHLRLWESSVTKRKYGTIKELVSKITADRHASFDSITWEWEIPAIPTSGIESEFILMCTNLKAQDNESFGYIHTSTYQKYIKEYKWADFIMKTLDIISRA